MNSKPEAQRKLISVIQRVEKLYYCRALTYAELCKLWLATGQFLLNLDTFRLDFPDYYLLIFVNVYLFNFYFILSTELGPSHSSCG